MDKDRDEYTNAVDRMSDGGDGVVVTYFAHIVIVGLLFDHNRLSVCFLAVNT